MRPVGIITVYLASAAIAVAAIAAAVAHWGVAVLILAVVIVAACALPRHAHGDRIVIVPSREPDARPTPLRVDLTGFDPLEGDRLGTARQGARR